MAGLNKIMVIGNLGTDPEMRYLPSGDPVTSFRLAVSRTYTTSDGERRDETEWFTVVAWRRLAELCNQYLSKGRQTYVEGRMRSRSWEGQDGQTRFVNEIVANQVVFLGRPSEAYGPEGSAEAAAEAAAGAGGEEEDLPF